MLLKRVFDLVCCLIALPIYGPVIAMIAIAVRVEDGDSVFFLQERIGKGGKRFVCFKFRTMRNGEITKVGKWLRMTGLDELAQIINIVKGEMSVVGPRPLTREDITRLDWSRHTFRWDIAPGLTGLAQIQSGCGARRSLASDRYYSRHISLKLDIFIVIASVCINIMGKRKFKVLQAQLLQWVNQTS